MSEKKLAFVFPGQAAQYVGMGKSVYERSEAARRVYEVSEELLGYDIARLCFEGPKQRLDETEITQPAVVVTSLATLMALWEEANVVPEVTAGHSLGEYSAAVCAGMLGLEDAIKLVSRRGRLMKDAVGPSQGGMVAVIGAARETVEHVCSELSAEGEICCANINCPGQIVISGESRLLNEAIERLRKLGARRLVKLPVSGPFHSRMMRGAAESFAAELDRTAFADGKVPVVVNATASPVKSADEMRLALKRQMTSPVLWEDCVMRMVELGVTDFVEIGPGRIVSSFIRRIWRDANVYSVQDAEALEEFVSRYTS